MNEEKIETTDKDKEKKEKEKYPEEISSGGASTSLAEQGEEPDRGYDDEKEYER